MTLIQWCKCKCRGGKNFGDVITPYIFKKITGEDSKKPVNSATEETVYFGAGSIMSLTSSFKNAVVWGTGIMFRHERFKKPSKVLSVRGPLTRKRFLEQGYDCPEVYGDIGLILPKFYNPTIEKKYKIGLIPHYVDYEKCKNLFENNEDVLIIDLCDPVETVVNNMLSCELTASTSLHGIIVSHAYNIHCCWVRMSEKIAGKHTKYLDYYGSLNMFNLTPVQIKNTITTPELINIIENYDNPTFPINTDHIIEICPFTSN